MQTKKTTLKTLLLFYLIPYIAVLLLTALDCVANFKYLEWYWLKEWMVVLPEMIAYYLLLAMMFAFFGVMVYFIFFGKTWQKWVFSAVSLAAAFLFPCLRYLVRHIGYGPHLTNVEMLDLYNEDITTGVTFLVYCALALFVILTERAYYAWILREKPRGDVKIYSPKHPVGLSMMIFFGALATWTTVHFIMIGDFVWESVLALLLEYVIDFAGFWIAVFAARTLAKWDAKTKGTV